MKANAELDADIKEMFDACKPLTQADLDELEAAAKELNNDPQFIADCLQDLETERLLRESETLNQ